MAALVGGKTQPGTRIAANLKQKNKVFLNAFGTDNANVRISVTTDMRSRLS